MAIAKAGAGPKLRKLQSKALAHWWRGGVKMLTVSSWKLVNFVESVLVVTWS